MDVIDAEIASWAMPCSCILGLLLVVDAATCVLLVMTVCTGRKCLAEPVAVH